MLIAQYIWVAALGAFNSFLWAKIGLWMKSRFLLSFTTKFVALLLFNVLSENLIRIKSIVGHLTLSLKLCSLLIPSKLVGGSWYWPSLKLKVDHWNLLIQYEFIILQWLLLFSFSYSEILLLGGSGTADHSSCHRTFFRAAQHFTTWWVNGWAVWSIWLAYSVEGGLVHRGRDGAFTRRWSVRLFCVSPRVDVDVINRLVNRANVTLVVAHNTAVALVELFASFLAWC